MSNWWDLDFSVAGPEPRVEELKAKLPKLTFYGDVLLFHHTEIVHETGSFVVIDAARNYWGLEAVSELVALFPDLTFHGSAWCTTGYDHYWVYDGRDGEIAIQDYVMADFEERFTRPVDRPEIEQRIANLGEKIDRLEAERNELKAYISSPAEKPADPEKRISDEGEAILAALRGGRDDQKGMPDCMPAAATAIG